MISRINEIKNMGIYKSFKASKDLQDFNRYNLFYGWNGSGKSTLTRMFSSLDKKGLNSNIYTSAFSLKLSDDKLITENSIRDHDLKIRVFNNDFIKENINWDGVAKSILLISKEKIDEGEQLLELKKKSDLEKSKISQLETQLEKEEKQIDAFLSTSAKNIKTSMSLIDASDRYYLNYNKKKLSDIIIANKETFLTNSFVLTDSEVSELRSKIKPVNKELISTDAFPKINLEKIAEADIKLSNLLTTNVTSTVIEKLKNNPKIQSWVHSGFILHRGESKVVCAFCENTISEGRMNDLENHFSKDFEELIQKLDAAIMWLKGMCIDSSFLPSSKDLYDEFIADFESLSAKLMLELELYNSEMKNLIVHLENKKSNPFNRIKFNNNKLAEICSNYNDALSNLLEVIESHNLKTRNFTEILGKNKKKFELHFANLYAKENEYFNTLSSIEENKKLLDVHKSKTAKLSYDIGILEKKLSNESLAAVEFNKQLHTFLGRGDISIEFSSNEKGYRIIREGSSERATSLSEGEKTAIAFVYFLIKLGEGSDKIGDTIVVIDDPISSFDSNHLFSAFTFLIKNCGAAKQLFVLTHNFWFFKLIRDWLKKGNRKDVSSFYNIETNIVDGNREAAIVNCNKTLTQYHSEYHFLFSTLLKYKNSQSMDMEVAYSLGNISRRLLESFISFKYPKSVNNLRAALESTGYDETKIERIYWYVQKYSHTDRIETHDAVPDNIITEGEVIINEVLDFLESVDKIHYDQLCEVCMS